MINNLFFIGGVFLSTIFTFGVRALMRHLNVTDKPTLSLRKIHKKPIPLGGGLAIYSSITLLTVLAYHFGLVGNAVPDHALFGLFLGGSILMIGGFLDDRYNLEPRYQILFPVAAAILLVLFGVYPSSISSPFGAGFELTTYALILPFGVLTLAHLVGLLWLMGMMYTTKFLDGLDGLVAGVIAIGATAIVLITRTSPWTDPEISLLALLIVASCLGFLVWNRHPASIFLGEGGSLLLGFWLGALALLSQSKIATIALILAVPILDVLRVLIRRVKKHHPFFLGDKEHLHYRLLDSGLSHRQTVFFFYGVSLLCGLLALLLQMGQTMVALGILAGLLCLTSMWLSHQKSKRH